MRVGIHINSSEPVAQAVVAGFQSLGWRTALRSGIHYSAGETENFDLIVVDGTKGNRRALVDDYAAKGIRALIIDHGHFRDVPGYWQLSIGALNRIPSLACPPDRFKALGLSVKTSGGNAKGYTLIAAQRPHDASHGLSANGYRAWLSAQDGKVRPHPLESAPDNSLADDLAGAKLVRTLCSTTGLDALLAGVPAVAELPDRAVWGELSGETLPSMADRLAMFSRIAYAQWTLDEIASGEAIQFTLDPKLNQVLVAAELAESVAESMQKETEPKKRGRPAKVKA